MNLCSHCKESLPAEGDFVVCKNCTRKLHYNCTTIPEKAWRTRGQARRDAWKCQFCRDVDVQAVSVIENSSSSTMASTSRPLAPVVQASKRTHYEITTSPVATNSAGGNDSTILAELSKLRAEIKDIAISCEFFANKYDELNANIAQNNKLMENLAKQITDLKESNEKKDETIKKMQTQINVLEQQTLKNNIEIKNIPPTRNENLVEIIKGIGKTINYEVKDNDITDIYRTKPKNPEKSLIVASFSSHLIKSCFIKQARATRSMQLKTVMQNTVNAPNPNQAWSNASVFVNNQLTKQNKQLLWMAKEKARQVSWSYVWESAGRVLAKKSESTNAVPIMTVDDPIPNDLSTIDENTAYSLTCSGLLNQSPSEERELRCGYLTETHPFLLLAPIKVEELSLDPLLVVFHDVIYENEIEKVIDLANGKITRAMVLSTNGSMVSTVRTSQLAFFPKVVDKVLQTIDQRVADMTGLNMEVAEQHQVANYGIGGHYGQHCDFFYKVHSAFDNVLGNRLATVLFYLTDVEQGGGTAFPELKRLLKPKKGAAAFWFNLHASGDGDHRTKHGACPLLVGSKWVLNRWIRERGQEFKRPCDLITDAVRTSEMF